MKCVHGRTVKHGILVATVLLVVSCSDQSKDDIEELRQRLRDLEDNQQPGVVPAVVGMGTSAHAATTESPFENSLGMQFVPVPENGGVLMCGTETRVADFRAYVEDVGYIQMGGVQVLSAHGGVHDATASWENPGFPQAADHPVTCVNWEEANGFCAWLTEQDRQAGLIGATDLYRLPTDAEWSAAAGTARYPWGVTFPPRAGVTNLAGSEAGTRGWPESYGTIPEYTDAHSRTAPVGSYPPNGFGFHDLGGNVAEWCGDLYSVSLNETELVERYDFLAREVDDEGLPCRVVRGGSWISDAEGSLRSATRTPGGPRERYDFFGFRVVLVLDDTH